MYIYYFNSFKERLSFLSVISIFILFDTSIWTNIISFLFRVGSAISYYCSLFCFPDCSDFGTLGALSKFGSCAFWHSILLFWTLPYFLSTQSIAQITCNFMWPIWNQPFLPRNPVTVVGKWYLKTESDV